jgi:hypothetical protein
VAVASWPRRRASWPPRPAPPPPPCVLSYVTGGGHIYWRLRGHPHRERRAKTRKPGSPRTATGERSRRNRGINTNCILDRGFYTNRRFAFGEPHSSKVKQNEIYMCSRSPSAGMVHRLCSLNEATYLVRQASEILPRTPPLMISGDSGRVAGT